MEITQKIKKKHTHTQHCRCFYTMELFLEMQKHTRTFHKQSVYAYQFSNETI